MNETPRQPRPFWVWLAVGRASTRSTALSKFTIRGLNLAILLAITGVESASESLLGKIAFALGLGGMVLNMMVAICVWLAVRWVDRHGEWACYQKSIRRQVCSHRTPRGCLAVCGNLRPPMSKGPGHANQIAFLSPSMARRAFRTARTIPMPLKGDLEAFEMAFRSKPPKPHVACRLRNPHIGQAPTAAGSHAGLFPSHGIS